MLCCFDTQLGASSEESRPEWKPYTRYEKYSLKWWRIGYVRPHSHITGYDSYPYKLYADSPCVHSYTSFSR